MDLFADKVLTAAKKAEIKKIISFSLSDYMPYSVKLGYKIKMPRIDTNYLLDSNVIQWTTFLKFADTLTESEWSHDFNKYMGAYRGNNRISEDSFAYR